MDPDLLAEVANLVEQPTPLRGSFDARFLELPREVLITVMQKKQRYFAVQDASGALAPYFIAVRNGDERFIDEVVAGNEHVLGARFADADFFFREDRKRRLEDRVDRLKTMTFQEKLGSLYDKTRRLVAYVQPMGELLELDSGTRHVAELAAPLAKADQGTSMVVEMTSLEGLMGRQYALLEGQRPEVAEAIYEHYLPRAAGGRLPETPAGTLLALADRLDSLVGLFALGLGPTASADPFALRRAALGVVQILLHHKIDLDLRKALAVIEAKQPVPVSQNALNEVVTFIAGRLEALLREEYGLPYDVVQAVLAEQAHNPYRALVGARELVTWIARPDWSSILDSFARCVRITRGQSAYALSASALTPAESVQLNEALVEARRALGASGNVDAFLSAFAPMVPAVTEFFDKVLVMDNDPAVRENRLALLQDVAALSAGYADLSKLTGF
jgi:glycyl-tRNA synthetase